MVKGKPLLCTQYWILNGLSDLGGGLISGGSWHYTSSGDRVTYLEMPLERRTLSLSSRFKRQKNRWCSFAVPYNIPSKTQPKVHM